MTVEGDDLLTTYEGWAPRGPVARIQDRFSPVEGDAFTSVTSSWRDGAWREMSSDRWTRVARG